MYKNINVLNKIMLSASVVCLCVAVYLACGFGTGAFVKCLPVLAAPVFLCALIAIYTPPVKTRTEKPSLMRRLSLCNVHMSKR